MVFLFWLCLFQLLFPVASDPPRTHAHARAQRPTRLQRLASHDVRRVGEWLRIFSGCCSTLCLRRLLLRALAAVVCWGREKANGQQQQTVSDTGFMCGSMEYVAQGEDPAVFCRRKTGSVKRRK